ncbi:hypothetical protein [Mucilaginibacter sp.]|uniref:hypothetical protein n=1 Tax=Mucilaginibacter sp. TaxID=1882438 RepID=UPI003D14678C
MKKINYLLVLAVVMLFASSCGKDGAVGPQGATGPQGPIGATGATGANGTAGTNGTNGATGATGATGTANVIYSDWVTPAAYTKTTLFNTYHFTYDIAAAKITQAILDNGVVLVYAKLNGYISTIWPTNQVSELPIIINYLQGTTPEIDTWSALSTVGNVRIDVTNNNNVYGSISNQHSFRYVIIPGGVKASSSINFKDYNQVKATFHITD